MIAPDLHQQKYARAGMTLVEMLVSLSLMAVLVTVSVSWLTNILARQGHEQERSRWTRAAYAVLDQIGRDLNQIERIDEDLRRGEPRIWIDEGTLCIRTTSSGEPVTQRYEFDPENRAVIRSSLLNREQSDDQPPLIGEVAELQFDLAMPTNERAVPALRVELRSVGGRSLTRFYPIRPEDVES